MLKSEAKQTNEHLTQTDADMKFVLPKDLDSLKLELLEKIEVIQSSLLKLSSEPKTETNTEKLVKTSPLPVVSADGSGISDTGKRSAQDKTSNPMTTLLSARIQRQLKMQAKSLSFTMVTLFCTE